MIMVSSLPLRTTMCRVLSFLMTSLTSLAETTDCPLMLMMTSFSLSPPLQHRGKRKCDVASPAVAAARPGAEKPERAGRGRPTYATTDCITVPPSIFRPNCQSCPQQKCPPALWDG